jgi:hypothetical protein
VELAEEVGSHDFMLRDKRNAVKQHDALLFTAFRKPPLGAPAVLP